MSLAAYFRGHVFLASYEPSASEYRAAVDFARIYGGCVEPFGFSIEEFDPTHPVDVLVAKVYDGYSVWTAPVSKEMLLRSRGGRLSVSSK